MLNRPLLAGYLTCKKCKTQRYKQQAYMNWHNVDCFITFFGITIIRNWWICNSCAEKAGFTRKYTYHDIDGHDYRFTKKWPFIAR